MQRTHLSLNKKPSLHVCSAISTARDRDAATHITSVFPVLCAVGGLTGTVVRWRFAGSRQNLSARPDDQGCEI